MSITSWKTISCLMCLLLAPVFANAQDPPTATVNFNTSTLNLVEGRSNCFTYDANGNVTGTQSSTTRVHRGGTGVLGSHKDLKVELSLDSVLLEALSSPRRTPDPENQGSYLNPEVTIFSTAARDITTITHWDHDNDPTTLAVPITQGYDHDNDPNTPEQTYSGPTTTVGQINIGGGCIMNFV